MGGWAKKISSFSNDTPTLVRVYSFLEMILSAGYSSPSLLSRSLIVTHPANCARRARTTSIRSCTAIQALQHRLSFYLIRFN